MAEGEAEEKEEKETETKAPSGMRKTAAGKAADKEVKKDEKGEKDAEESKERKPVKTRVTFWQTFKGGLLSAPTIILFAFVGMNLYGRGGEEKAEQSWVLWAAPLILLGSMAVGSALVTQMENSEWRQNLRAEVAEKERNIMEKKGISQQDLNEAAVNMGIQPTNFGQG